MAKQLNPTPSSFDIKSCKKNLFTVYFRAKNIWRSGRRRIKILLVLLAVAILAALCLIVIFRPVNNVEKQADKGREKVDLKKLEEKYKVETKNILTDYSTILESDSLSVEKVEADKNKLLDLKVPVQFKDLHLNFVLAISKMEDYLKDGKDEDKISSERMISEIKANYLWLN